LSVSDNKTVAAVLETTSIFADHFVSVDEIDCVLVPNFGASKMEKFCEGSDVVEEFKWS
jgi:hypothetical protein